MIRELETLTPWLGFVDDVNADPSFSDPMLSTPEQIEQNLLRAIEKPNDHVLGVFRDGELIGLFDFLILPEERYAEMIVGLSRAPEAYEELITWLKQHCPGYCCDFVFNPANRPLRALLEREGADFFEEQQKMVLADPPEGADTAGIEPLSEALLPQYLAMHGTDAYWTGEKVAAAPERFRVFLAVDAGRRVVGYLDITCKYEENEPYDLFVAEAERRKGWGRKLLAAAIEANRPNGMMLLVELRNTAAIRLYESSGFVKIPGQNNQTVRWTVGGA